MRRYDEGGLTAMKKFLLSRPQQRFVFALTGVVLGGLALLTPVWDIADPASFVGGLLVWAALLVIFHGFRRSEQSSRHSAWFSGAITLLIGALLINADLFQRQALVRIILALFVIDALRYFFLFVRNRRKGQSDWNLLLSGLGNFTVVVFILIFHGKGPEWSLTLSAALRIFGTVWNLLTAKTGTLKSVAADVIRGLGISEDADLEAFATKLGKEDDQRNPIDAGWVATFLVILFFIHLGRMGLDRSALGILSPVVAVIGDIFIAMVVAFGIIAPVRAVFRKVTGVFLIRTWTWVQKVPETQRRTFSLRTLALAWVTQQLRLSISIRKSGYSLRAAFRNGLKIGLPFSALLAAVIPVLGMSWYFDTENWASGVWDSYAASRVDAWREAMITVSGEGTGPLAFQLHPSGITVQEDWSFVVVGDPGEGDASQLVLKDQILAVAEKPEVKFVVISSDIVYPSGAMKDYERKFFLPFKGVRKPVYAIPGNHDWYDALDAFAATFYTPEAARRAMEARIRSDRKLSSTTSEVIDGLVAQATFLRNAYQLPTGYQNVPFFQISNDHFTLLAIDTGVRRQVDSLQLAWIRSVLEASKGKFVMALLGHPFYAAGEYQGNFNPDFEALHELLRSYKVPLVMAGDTHDLEYYRESPAVGAVMHHFVNGGGGAYLSMGAAMAPEAGRPTTDWVTYPAREPLMQKVDSLTPMWKYPAWAWVKTYNGYPFSAEWLSAAFDYNEAPYFQSFMEIVVEQSLRRVRLLPYGIHGRLRWSDFDHGGLGMPASAQEEDFAEWILPMDSR